jgi:anti-sigma factor RsiW
MADNCIEWRDKLSEYIDGEMPDGDRRALEAHLAACGDCRSELDALRAAVEAVAALPVRPAPANLASAVVAGIRSEPSPPEPRVIPLLLTRILPVAAMVLVVLGLTLLITSEGRPRNVLDHAKMAMHVAAEPEDAAEIEPPSVSTDEDYGLLDRTAGAGLSGASGMRELATAPRDEARARVEGEAVEAKAWQVPGVDGVYASRRAEEATVSEALPPATARGARGYVERAAAPAPITEGAAATEEHVAATAGQPARIDVLHSAGESERRRAAVPATPGLHWSDNGTVAETAADDEMPRLAVRTRADGPVTGPAAIGSMGQSVVFLEVEEPVAAMLRMVQAANEEGVPVTVALPQPAGTEGVDLYLRVPPDQVAALVQRLRAGGLGQLTGQAGALERGRESVAELGVYRLQEAQREKEADALSRMPEQVTAGLALGAAAQEPEEDESAGTRFFAFGAGAAQAPDGAAVVVVRIRPPATVAASVKPQAAAEVSAQQVARTEAAAESAE